MKWRRTKTDESDVQEAALFVKRTGSQIHDSLGGPTQINTARGQFEAAKPYIHLEEALRQYVPGKLGVEITENAWEDLWEKISDADYGYQESNKGSVRQLWWKLGSKKEHIMPWLELIPDTHGLGVVRAGMALVLKLAEDSMEQRDKIFKAFEDLRDALVVAQSKRKSFRTDPKIADYANRLYVAIVLALEDLILTLVPRKATWRRWIPRFEHKPDPEDPETILQRVAQSSRDLELAIGVTRDQKIENTERLAQNTNAQVSYVRQDVIETKITAKETGVKIDLQTDKINEQGQRLERVDDGVVQVRGIVREMSEDMVYIRGGMDRQEKRLEQIRYKMFKEEDRAKRIVDEKLNRKVEKENAFLSAQLQAQNDMLQLLLEDGRRKDALIAELSLQKKKSGAVVGLDRFCDILVQAGLEVGEVADLDMALRHPNDDLERALMQKTRFKPSAQAQAQSLLKHRRFTEWLSQCHPDFIFVEANISSAAMEKLSVVSTFCATFVGSMKKAQPQEVVVHFFCGLHNTTNDPWLGPNGLVRSVLLQLVMRLEQMNLLSLDFINDRDFLKDLESHDLPSLCQALHELVSQFPPDLTVYLVIDSISMFDRGKLFNDLQTMISWLRYIVQDRSLAPMFKVLITTPKNCTLRVKKLLEPECMVLLSSNNLTPMEIMSSSVEKSLLRPTTPDIHRLSLSPSSEDLHHNEGGYGGYETD